MSARTRRQKAAQQAQAQAQAQGDDEHSDSLANGHSNGSKNGSAESPKMNGSARRKRSPPRDGQHSEKENIFLFWPNIIGRPLNDITLMVSWIIYCILTVDRIHPYCPRNRLALLHAPSPPNMLGPVQRLLPA